MTETGPYERHAVPYDAWFARNRFAYESELDAVRALLPRGGAGVEIGVGTGRFAGELGIALGVEPAEPMGRIAQTRGIRVIAGVAEALPLRDGRFDFALMVTVLCFFVDPAAALREAHRVIRPGGSIVIAFLDRDSPLGKTYDERKAESLFYRQANFRSAREVEAMLGNAGFRAPVFRQTIFGGPDTMGQPDPVREGHGEGCFVVVRARR